jgi:hypothetical protein
MLARLIFGLAVLAFGALTELVRFNPAFVPFVAAPVIALVAAVAYFLRKRVRGANVSTREHD